MNFSVFLFNKQQATSILAAFYDGTNIDATFKEEITANCIITFGLVTLIFSVFYKPSCLSYLIPDFSSPPNSVRVIFG